MEPALRVGGFMLWNTARINEFKRSNPEAFVCDALYDHDEYDLWLLETIL